MLNAIDLNLVNVTLEVSDYSPIQSHCHFPCASRRIKKYCDRNNRKINFDILSILSFSRTF